MKQQTIPILFLFILLTACNSNKGPGFKHQYTGAKPNTEAREDSNKFSDALSLMGRVVTGIVASAETDPVKASVNADAADDPAVFKLGGQVFIAGSNKTGGIHVYDISGHEIKYLDKGLINNIDCRDVVNIAGDTITFLGGTDMETNSIYIYRVGFNSMPVFSDSLFMKIPTNYKSIYGFCMYLDQSDNKLYAFANSKSGEVGQWLIDPFSIPPAFQKVRELKVRSQPEGMVANDKTATLYLGEEMYAIHIFDASPAGIAKSEILPSSRSGNPNINYDIEGLALFSGVNSDTYLMASIQGSFSYAVFDINRREYLFSFKIEEGVVDAVEETDGIEVFDGYISEKYPGGILVVQDGFNYDNGKALAQNFKILDLNKIRTIADSLVDK